MTSNIQQPFARAMAFYNADGLPAAWKQASKFAGHNGRIATAPDFVAARLATGIDEYPWSAYFTTSTAEYFGKSKEGKYIIIVAHGIGPMATLDGIQKAYSWEYQDKDRRRRGGRITEREFRDLEAGVYGEVSIVDYEAYCTLYEYPLYGVIYTSRALTDPILRARFGPRAEEYVQAHAEHARRWHREQAGISPDCRYILPDGEVLHEEYVRMGHGVYGADNSDPYIVTVAGANNCCYGNPRFKYREIEEGYALAHLVSVCQLSHCHHEHAVSLVSDINLHEWGDGVRLIAVSSECELSKGIQEGPDPERLLRTYWRDLLVTMPDEEEIGFRALIRVDDELFTRYPKKGEGMDRCDPEYHVTSFEKIGEPVRFTTTIGGYYGFFKYGINEVKAIAPRLANAYEFIGDVSINLNQNDSGHHTCLVQFYRIEADTTKRLMLASQLRHDYATLMALMEREALA